MARARHPVAKENPQLSCLSRLATSFMLLIMHEIRHISLHFPLAWRLSGLVPEEAEVVLHHFHAIWSLAPWGFDRGGSIGRASGPRSMAVAMAAGAAVSASAWVPPPICSRTGFCTSAEVTYRGEVHRGEHEPILDRDVFEAEQAKRAANAAARQGPAQGLRGHSGRTHLRRPWQPHEPDACERQKRGARYRYYVSHAILQRSKGSKQATSPACRLPRLRPSCCEGMHQAPCSNG